MGDGRAHIGFGSNKSSAVHNTEEERQQPVVGLTIEVLAYWRSFYTLDGSIAFGCFGILGFLQETCSITQIVRGDSIELSDKKVKSFLCNKAPQNYIA